MGLIDRVLARQETPTHNWFDDDFVPQFLRHHGLYQNNDGCHFLCFSVLLLMFKMNTVNSEPFRGTSYILTDKCCA